MFQGPPGTGKTTFAAEILLGVFDIFGLSANCYTSSNAACDVFVAKINPELKAIRFHGVSMEYAGFRDGPPASLPNDKATASSSTSAAAPPDPDDEATAISSTSAAAPPDLCSSEVAWKEFVERYMRSEAWNRTSRLERPNYGSHGMYIRACERANLLDKDGQLSLSLPDNVTEAHLKWARQFYRVDSRVERPRVLAKKRLKQANWSSVADTEDQINEDQAGQEVVDAEDQIIEGQASQEVVDVEEQINEDQAGQEVVDAEDQVSEDQASQKVVELEPTFRDLTMELFADTLQSANYIVTTCSNAAVQLLRENTSPKIVIIDEAGVAKETEALLAILHNLSSVVMVIFLGDHNQLRPTVISLYAKLIRDDPTSHPYNIFAPQLSTSLMSRQIENGMPYTMFTKQYRMTAGLELLSSNMCYGGRLENVDSTLLVNRPQL